MSDTDKAPYERLADLEEKIYAAVPPIEPPPVHWLTSDASDSYCYEHVRDARWEEMGNVGPTYPDTDRWYQRPDDVQRSMDEGIDYFMEGCPSDSDSTESCSTCGCTLDYLLTDYGLDQELDHYAKNPIGLGEEITGELTYSLTRLFINMTQPWAAANCPDKVMECLKIAEDTWAAIEHAKGRSMSEPKLDTREWWEREGLTEPCPNWREGTRRCNCKACRTRRKAAA